MTTLNCLNIYAACAQMQKGYKTQRRRVGNLCAVLNITRKNKEIHWNILKANFDSLLSFSRIYCVPYLKSSIRQVSWNIIDFFINTSLVFFSSSKWQSNSHKTGSKSHDTLNRPRRETDKRCPITRCSLTFFAFVKGQNNAPPESQSIKKRNAKGYTAKRVSDGLLQDDVFVCCLCKANKTDKWSPSDKDDDDVNF